MPALLLLALACSRSAVPPTPEVASASPTPSPSPVADAMPRESLRTPTEPPPQVDTSIADVPLEDVVFDTFRGGFIRLSEAAEETIEALRDRIKPIYEPRYEPVEGGDWLDDQDTVIGYVSLSGGAFAYPLKIMNFHEIVNDLIDGVPVLVVQHH